MSWTPVLLIYWSSASLRSSAGIDTASWACAPPASVHRPTIPAETDRKTAILQWRMAPPKRRYTARREVPAEAFVFLSFGYKNLAASVSDVQSESPVQQLRKHV